MQARIVVNQDLDLLAALIEGITHSSVLTSRVLLVRYIYACLAFHVLRTLNQRADVVACYSYSQQTYRSKHRETATYVIRDDKGLVSLFGSQAAESTFGTVGNSHNTVTCFLFAHFLFQHRLQETKSQSGLGGGTGLGYIDYTKLFVRKELHQVSQIVLADVVAGK